MEKINKTDMSPALDDDLDKSWRKTADAVRDAVIAKCANGQEYAVIAVGGPGGTGKSTFSRMLCSVLDDSSILRLDDYKTPRDVRSLLRIYGPHPNANYMDLVRSNIEDIKNGIPFFKPVYDRETGHIEVTEIYRPKKYNILDGEISTYGEFRDMVDISVYIDADHETQLNARLERDVNKRKYSLKKAVDTFLGSNLKEYSQYGLKTKQWADITLYCTVDHCLHCDEL